MPTEVIAGNLTTTYFADSNDTIVLTAGASLITAGQVGISTRTGNESHVALVINGTVGTTSPFVGPIADGAAIYLSANLVGGVRPVTENYVRVGETGHVFSAGGIGIFGVGSGTRILNYGLVEAVGAIEMAGSNNLVQNHGTINFGVTGIGSGGESSYATIQNFGTIQYDADFALAGRNNVAIMAFGDHAKVFNSGMINCQNGISVYGEFSTVKNTGTIEATGLAVSVILADNFRLDNSGTLLSTGPAATAVQLNGQINSVLINSGIISADGTAVVGSATRIVNTGNISGTDTGVNISSQSDFTLVNSNSIGGNAFGVIINDFTGNSISTVYNSGTISGQVAGQSNGESVRIEGGTARINSTGTLVGDVYLNGLINVLTNSGLIDGDVFGNYGRLVYKSAANGVVTGTVIGSFENDSLQGGDSVDRFFGSEGNDLLNGGGGNDVLNGGFARDVLTGGTGADIFIFSTAEDIRTSFYGSDRITDFQTGIDHIDLSAFMAGGQFIGGALFTGHANEVRYNASTGNLVGDVNGDRVFDWSMALTNKAALTAADFIF